MPWAAFTLHFILLYTLYIYGFTLYAGAYLRAGCRPDRPLCDLQCRQAPAAPSRLHLGVGRDL